MYNLFSSSTPPGGFRRSLCDFKKPIPPYLRVQTGSRSAPNIHPKVEKKKSNFSPFLLSYTIISHYTKYSLCRGSFINDH